MTYFKKMGIRHTFRTAVWGAGVMKDALIELIKHPINSVAGAADLRRLLNVLDKAPGIEDKKADAAFLSRLIAVIQMDRLSFCITYDDQNRTEIDILRIDHITDAQAYQMLGKDIFGSAVISQGSGKKKPDITLMLNKDNFRQNRDKVTADAMIEPLLFPIKKVPVVGGVIATIVRWPVHKISGFIITTLDNTAESLGVLPPKNKQPPQSPPQP